MYSLNKNNEVNNLYADFINIDKMSYVEQNIKKYIQNIVKIKKDESSFSDKFIILLYNMMNIDEGKRFNFYDIINYIQKEYKLDQMK